MINKLKNTGLFFIFIVFIVSSCSKNETQNVTARVFINNQLYPTNEYKFTLRTVLDGKNNGAVKAEKMGGDTLLRFPARITMPVQEKTVVKCEMLDAAFVAAYNKEKGTGYLLLPSDNYVFEKNEVTIEPGQTVSKDFISVRLKLQKNLDLTVDYMLGVRIASVSGSSAVASSNMALVKAFSAIRLEIENIMQDNAQMTGAFIDRKGWTAEAVGENPMVKASFVLDDNYNTSWYTTTEQANIVIDMKEFYTLKGIQIAANYVTDSSYNAEYVSVATSLDNRKWVAQDTYSIGTFSGNPAAPDNKNINFYIPQKARYIRLSYSGGSSIAGASEIKPYK